MNFRVYEKDTDKDVTEYEEWFIDPDGDLRYRTDDTSKVGFPLAIANGDYYYKIEIECSRNRDN